MRLSPLTLCIFFLVVLHTYGQQLGVLQKFKQKYNSYSLNKLRKTKQQKDKEVLDALQQLQRIRDKLRDYRSEQRVLRDQISEKCHKLGKCSPQEGGQEEGEESG